MGRLERNGFQNEKIESALGKVDAFVGHGLYFTSTGEYHISCRSTKGDRPAPGLGAFPFVRAPGLNRLRRPVAWALTQAEALSNLMLITAHAEFLTVF